MPQLSFTLDSISQSEYESLMQGYQDIMQVVPPPRSFYGSLQHGLKRIASVLPFVKENTPANGTALHSIGHAYHPILDPEFLEFCIAVARLLCDGALLGAGDGEDFFYPNGLTLSQRIDGNVTIICGGSRLMIPITPHTYVVAVSDVPVYARLCALQRLTKDHSMGELLNRLALWLAHFVYTAHFGRNIVAYNPERNTKQVLNKEFFTRISSSMFP